MKIHQRLENLGILIPEILLPKPDLDLKKWAVIACDQFTQDPAYWARTETFVGDAPSTLRLILPEIYLGQAGQAQRIRGIHETMGRYLSDTFRPPQSGLMYLERSTPYRKLRRGLLVAVDLERYDWKKDAQTLIRATEGTVEDRLPPRLAVRRGAPLECSHVILLIDDEKDTLMPALGDFVKALPAAYRTELTAGSVAGWLLDQEEALTRIADSLEALAQKSFLFAVGDGNHSLAAAKAVWEEYKARNPQDLGHPCRYALVEVENLYDSGLGFEPIHRLMLGAKLEEVKNLLKKLPDSSFRRVETREELIALVSAAGVSRIGLAAGTEYGLAEFRAQQLLTEHLQPLLDEFLAEKGPGYGIDYVHGQASVFAGNYRGVGLLLPPISRAGLFKTVAHRGPGPRKSFSLGEAEEKRFYLECRRLF